MKRFWDKVKKTKSCWIWTASKTKGYGLTWVYPKRILAHRLSYQMHKGEIPKGYHIDHLCRNPACVNPEHLEAVTCRENIIRGIGPSALHAKKTHCVRGHELSGENIKMNAKGARLCILCKKYVTQKISELVGPTRSQDHCINGHEYTAENTLINSKGCRHCRICHNQTANLPAYKDRTRCKNGHRYTEKTIYLNPRGIKECRVCRYERSQKRYQKFVQIKHLI